MLSGTGADYLCRIGLEFALVFAFGGIAETMPPGG
jgi:hypothetical protein